MRSRKKIALAIGLLSVCITPAIAGESQIQSGDPYLEFDRKEHSVDISPTEIQILENRSLGRDDSASYELAIRLLRGYSIKQDPERAMKILNACSSTKCQNRAHYYKERSGNATAANNGPDGGSGPKVYSCTDDNGDGISDGIQLDSMYGTPEAFFELGEYYYHGILKTPMNQIGVKEQLTGIESNAKAGSSDRALSTNDYLIKPNPHKAFDYFRRAAETGEPRATFRVAQFYDKGISVAQDSNLALRWYLMAMQSAQKHLKQTDHLIDRGSHQLLDDDSHIRGACTVPSNIEGSEQITGADSTSNGAEANAVPFDEPINTSIDMMSSEGASPAAPYERNQTKGETPTTVAKKPYESIITRASSRHNELSHNAIIENRKFNSTGPSSSAKKRILIQDKLTIEDLLLYIESQHDGVASIKSDSSRFYTDLQESNPDRVVYDQKYRAYQTDLEGIYLITHNYYIEGDSHTLELHWIVDTAINTIQKVETSPIKVKNNGYPDLAVDVDL